MFHTSVRQLRWTAVCVAVALSAGCASSGAFWGGVAAGMAGATTPASTSSIFPASPELLLFGGSGHRVFLGCLNCSKYDPNSIFNAYGTHGSPYGAESIFNRYGEYGSPYSSSSACNQYASDPPIIVDREGNSYGRLTLNRYGSQVNSSSIVAWLTGVCSGR